MQCRKWKKRLQTTQALPLIPTISPSFSAVSTHTLEDPVMPVSKCLKTLGQPNTNVLYGPVNSNGNPHVIANAAMDLI